MSNITYSVRNNSIDLVKIEATYKSSVLVPSIGTRRRMQVNGSAQLMTLNNLRVTRRADWKSEKKRFDYIYDAVEEWGDFYIS